MSQILLALGIVATLWSLFFLAGEISLWFAMRAFRNEDAPLRDEARRRLRKAFYDGALSIGDFGRRRP